ncbi:MAG: MBOAT family protein, partial [Geobacteraceae bacterium]
MLFNSFEFILVFLPITVVIYFLLLRWRLTIAAKSWLLSASLFFYSWWNIKYLPLILGSVLFNYTIGGLLVDYEEIGRKILSKKTIFVFGVTANVILLG